MLDMDIIPLIIDSLGEFGDNLSIVVVAEALLKTLSTN